MYGVDVGLRSNGQYTIFEINYGPHLGTENNIDLDVKTFMLKEAFQICGFRKSKFIFDPNAVDPRKYDKFFSTSRVNESLYLKF